MSKFKPVGCIMFCPHCRKAYLGKGHTLDDKCPCCGQADWDAYLNADTLMDDIENSQALRFVIDNAHDEVVDEVADIMGFHGGCCCDKRQGSECITALRVLEDRL